MSSNQLRKDGERAARRFMKKIRSEERLERLRGEVVVFEYPDANYEHVVRRYSKRIFRVDDGADFAREFGSKRSDKEASRRDPHLRRLGKLIAGIDLAVGTFKTFYHGAMRNLRRATKQEIATVTPATPGSCHVILIKGREVCELAARDVQLNENEAGRWLDNFNRTMRKSAWRAALIRPGSLGRLPRGVGEQSRQPSERSRQGR